MNNIFGGCEMKYDLFKIISPEYADDFINGKLYMNTLDFFRGGTKNVAQGDWQEGTCGTINKNQLRQFGYSFLSTELDILANDNVTMLSDYYAFNNIFCMYSLHYDDERRIVYKPDGKIYEFNDENDDEKIVVHITNTEDFFRKLDIAISKYLEANKIEYGIYGEITYSSAWANADGMGTRSAFHKEPSYSYQKEWRLCILQKLIGKSPFIMEIGDLSDISEKISIDTFVNHIEEIFPDYIIEEHCPDMKQNVYKTMGSINMINQLMYSYTGLSNSITRSDKAQADWHYAQYLILSDKYDEADAYLEKQMIKERDLDHLDLVVQNRMPEQWVKATDAYMFFIKECPDIVKAHAERFFFGLHMILMINMKPADAAKLYFKAKEEFELKENLIMYSDFMFALGFYDQVLPVYEELQAENDDPILLYDLAIANTFVLNFDKAMEYINEFEAYFSNSVRTSDNTKKINDIIDCFKNEKAIQENRQSLFENTEEIDFEKIKNGISGKSVLAGINILYNMQKNGCIDYLNEAEEVNICPATVQVIIEEYMNTGDRNIFDLIINLKNMRNLKIISPDIKTYIALEVNQQNTPGYMIMEKALMAEQMNSITE